MKTRKDQALDTAVVKWYVHERFSGMKARCVKPQADATKLAAHLGNTNFKVSEGWLWRFRNCHGLFKRGAAW